MHKLLWLMLTLGISITFFNVWYHFTCDMFFHNCKWHCTTGLDCPLTSLSQCCLRGYQPTKLIVSDSYTLYPGYPPRPIDPFSHWEVSTHDINDTRSYLYVFRNQCQHFSWKRSQGCISESKGVWVLYFSRRARSIQNDSAVWHSSQQQEESPLSHNFLLFWGMSNAVIDSQPLIHWRYFWRPLGDLCH